MMCINLLRYTIFMQSAGKKTRGDLRNFPQFVMNITVAAVLEGPAYAAIYLQSRYKGIDTAIQIRCPPSRYTTYNLLWSTLPIHIRQGPISFVEILAQHLRRYNVSGFLCRQLPHSLPMLPLIGSASPPLTLLEETMRSFPRCNST